MKMRHAGAENFPVASRLLPARVRPHVLAFYAFARAADDIADNPAFSAREKIETLTLWAEQLACGGAGLSRPVADFYASLQATGVTNAHGQDLLKAFMRDALTPRTASWDELMDYCRLSAAPVGRYLIDLMDGGQEAYPASDALCAALQVINHIQDMKADYCDLGRIYIPADWMAEAGAAPTDLVRDTLTPQLRCVVERMLERTEDLLRRAKPLPGLIRTRPLGREAGGILAIAHRLVRTLRHSDPLARRVALSRPQAMVWFLWGALNA